MKDAFNTNNRIVFIDNPIGQLYNKTDNPDKQNLAKVLKCTISSYHWLLRFISHSAWLSFESLTKSVDLRGATNPDKNVSPCEFPTQTG